MICPNCGTQNERGGQLCVRCHNPMPTEATQAPAYGYNAGNPAPPAAAPAPAYGYNAGAPAPAQPAAAAPQDDFVVLSQDQAARGPQPPPVGPPLGQYGAPPPGQYAPQPPQGHYAAQPPPAGQYGAPPPGQYAAGPPPGQYGAPPPGQYAAGPPAGQYGAPPPGQYAASPPPGQYAAQPPQGQYGAPPPGQYAAGPPPGQYGAPPPTAPYPVAVPPPGQPPRKGHLLRNVLIALALLAVVGVGSVAYLATQTLAPVAAGKLLPADVLAFTSFDPHPAGGQKVALDKMQAAFQGQPGWQAALDKIKSQSASVSDTLTATVKGCLDTAPAAGTTPTSMDEATAFLGHNVTLAMLSISKDETTKMLNLKGGNAGDEVSKMLLPKVVLIADLDLAALAKQGLPGGLKKGPGGNGKVTDIPVVEKYKDVEIRKISTAQCATDAKDQPLYVALLGSTAAMTFDQNTLHGVIDRYKDSKANNTLADSAPYTSLEADLPAAKDRLGLAYINMTSVYSIIQQVSEKTQADLRDALSSNGTPSPPATKMVKVSGAVAMSLAAHDDGMQVDTVSDTQLDGQAVGTGAAPAADALNDVPAGSWAFYSGADLKTQITQALDLSRKQGMQQQIDDGLAQMKQQFGVDLEKDVLPLLGGDYLISMGGRQDTGSTMHFTGALELRLKAGDGAKMNNVLNTLHQSLTAGGGAGPQTVAVGSASLFGFEGLPALYGVVGDKMYALGSTDSSDPDAAKTYADGVLSGAGKGMGTDPTIRARLAHVPANSTATLYVDLGKIRQEGVEPTLQGDSKDTYESQFAPFARPFQYLLAGGNTTIRNSMNHGHSVLFVAIGK